MPLNVLKNTLHQISSAKIRHLAVDLIICKLTIRSSLSFIIYLFIVYWIRMHSNMYCNHTLTLNKNLPTKHILLVSTLKYFFSTKHLRITLFYALYLSFSVLFRFQYFFHILFFFVITILLFFGT